MNRLYALLLVLCCLVPACGTLPKLKPGKDNAQIFLPQACRAVFPEGRWQFFHSIEAAFPGGGENLLMGVTVVDTARRTIDCALMTVEGFVLFQAHMGKALRVDRAMPPFDREGFAGGMLADIQLMFLAPAAEAVATGQLAEDGFPEQRPVCRYTGNRGIITDVMPGADSRWQLRRYSPQGRLTRTVVAENRGGQAGFPGTLTLTAHGLAGYTLALKLVNAVHLDE